MILRKLLNFSNFNNNSLPMMINRRSNKQTTRTPIRNNKNSKVAPTSANNNSKKKPK